MFQGTITVVFAHRSSLGDGWIAQPSLSLEKTQF